MSRSSGADQGAALAGPRLVAILLLAIRRDAAVALLRRLDDEGLQRIAGALQELAGLAVTPQMVQRVLLETVQRVQDGGGRIGDVGRRVDGLLREAVGPERAAAVRDAAAAELRSKRPFAVFDDLSPEDLADLLADEHPQIAAVFIAHLERGRGGAVIRRMPESRRADLVYRVSTLDRTPQEVVQRVLDVMQRKVRDLGLTVHESAPQAWIKVAAEILNTMGGREKEILETIGVDHAEVAAAIRDEMLSFDDLANLDPRSTRRLLRRLDTRTVAAAIKGAPAAVRANLLDNLSKRAADAVDAERDRLGPLPASRVQAARDAVLAVVRQLVQRREIAAPNGAGEPLLR